ncbi:MAG: hypothetical protein U0263_17275 [Polyangiaceae bacterium]
MKSAGWDLGVRSAFAVAAGVLLSVYCMPSEPPRAEPAPAPTRPDASLTASPVGRWIGYVEAAPREGAWDELELMVEAVGPSGVTGTLRVGFGDAALGDPDLGERDAGWRRFFKPAGMSRVALSNARVDGARLRFEVEHRAFSRECEATPAGAPAPGLDVFGCPEFGSSTGASCEYYVERPPRRLRWLDGGAADAGVAPRRSPIDCAVLARCDAMQRFCECHDGGVCRGRVTFRARFDLRVEGDELDGSAELGQRVSRVRFTRSP